MGRFTESRIEVGGEGREVKSYCLMDTELLLGMTDSSGNSQGCATLRTHSVLLNRTLTNG